MQLRTLDGVVGQGAMRSCVAIEILERVPLYAEKGYALDCLIYLFGGVLDYGGVVLSGEAENVRTRVRGVPTGPHAFRVVHAVRRQTDLHHAGCSGGVWG